MSLRTNVFAASCSLAFVAVLQSGCATAPKTAVPATQPGQQTLPQAAPQVLAGKVVETMNSGGYTYINLEDNGKKTWVAVPPMKVQAGDDVKLYPGMPMGAFTSKTLNRTFDNIIFSPGPVNETAAPDQKVLPAVDPNAKLPAGHPVINRPKTDVQPTVDAQKATDQQKQIDETLKSMPAGHKAMGGGNAVAGTLSGKVAETMNSGGYTYICLEKDGKKTWAAVPTTEIAVGQNVQLASGMAMTNFNSKTLNRTFESIVFSSGVVK